VRNCLLNYCKYIYIYIHILIELLIHLQNCPHIYTLYTHMHILLFIQFLFHRRSSRIKIIVKTVTFFQSLLKFLECLIWWPSSNLTFMFYLYGACSLQ
jgi:hypothetical protein